MYPLSSCLSYNPRNYDKTKFRKDGIKNASIFIRGRDLVVLSFENDVFSLPQVPQYKKPFMERYSLLN